MSSLMRTFVTDFDEINRSDDEESAYIGKLTGFAQLSADPPLDKEDTHIIIIT